MALLPAILACDSISWRLDQLEAALARILAAFPKETLSGVVFGFRTREDLVILVLEPGPKAGPKLGALATQEARLSGLKSLDVPAAGMTAEKVVAKATQGCSFTMRITSAAEAIARLRGELGIAADRRGAMRFGAALPIRYETPAGFIDAYTRDLSSGGLFVSATGATPAIGSAIAIEIYAPGDPAPVRATGTVAHHGDPTRGEGFGVRLALSVAAKDRLAAAVRRLKTVPQPDNRRREARVPATLEVVFATDEELLNEYTENISKGGAFVTAEQPPAFGTQLVIVLKLPSGAEVRAQAEVVRVVSPEQAKNQGAKPGVGVAFKGFEGDGKEKLENYVSAKLAELERPRLRVLVIDDQAPFRDLISRTLSAKGCEVLEAATGEEGFEKIVEELLSLDLLVLDLNLPDIRGEELLARIRNFGETELVVAVCSAYVGDAATETQLSLSGADDVIPKSLSPLQIADRLVKLVQARRRV